MSKYLNGSFCYEITKILFNPNVEVCEVRDLEFSTGSTPPENFRVQVEDPRLVTFQLKVPFKIESYNGRRPTVFVISKEWQHFLNSIGFEDPKINQMHIFLGPVGPITLYHCPNLKHLKDKINKLLAYRCSLLYRCNKDPKERTPAERRQIQNLLDIVTQQDQSVFHDCIYLVAYVYWLLLEKTYERREALKPGTPLRAFIDAHLFSVDNFIAQAYMVDLEAWFDTGRVEL